MSIVINARGTSVPFFKIGKTGTTLYQGSIDPSLAYTPANGDVWFNTNTNALESWHAPTTSWTAPRLADLNFGSSSVIAGPSADLTLQTDANFNVVLNAGAGPATLTTTIGNDLHVSEPIGGGLYLNTLKWPSMDGMNGQSLITNGSGVLSWTYAASGTVTSVGLEDTSITSIFNITNTPVTSSGALTIALANQPANTVFSGPSSNSGQPYFRSLTYSDLPTKLYKENPIAPSQSTATGTNAVAIGEGARASIDGMKAFANGKFANAGDAQHGVYILRNTTTDATPTELFVDGGSVTILIPINSVFSFSIMVAAKRTDGAGAAGYKFDGIIQRDTLASSVSFIGVPSRTILGETDQSWDIAISPNTTNGTLKIMATGEAAKTIRWVATVSTTEVTN